MRKEIINKDKLQSPKLEGMDKLADIVKRTLGPGGLPIVIERVGQALDGSPLGPKITKDGVSVAEECFDQNEDVNVIIQTVKAICKKTNSDAGDGTTTAIVLGQALLKAAEDVMTEGSNLNPQLVKESLEAASKEVLEDLKKLAQPIKGKGKIKEVATISANGDESVGKIISEAFDAVGAEGVVTVDEGSSNEVTLDIVDGYQFDRGAQSRDNFFNNKSITAYEAEKARVILFDGPIRNFTDLVPSLILLAGVNQETGQATKPCPPIVVIANEFSRDVIQFMLIQAKERGVQFCAVQGPHMTHIRTGYYDDLATYTGGTRLGNGGKALTEITEEDIGTVDKIVIDKYKTTLYGGHGFEDDILERVDQLKELKARAESPYDAQITNDRIAALTNGVAKIGVGGVTELEVKEKYDRIEDALNAARAAIQEGVVAGGGTALLRLADKIDASQSVGHEILKRALRAPFDQILENIGTELVEEERTKLCTTDNLVYDARNKKFVDGMNAGIIDPVKVTRSALENAVSIAGLLSTTGGAIIYRKGK